jgi:hypothetical protein
MKTWMRTSMRCISVVLVCALLAPSLAVAAPKPLTPEKVHARILKRGLGNWVGVELQNGVAFGGMIISIDDQSFGLQLHNDPQVTQVLYSDVADLNTVPTRGTGWAIAGIAAGGFVAMGLIAHHAFEANKAQMPTLPTQPVFP